MIEVAACSTRGLCKRVNEDKAVLNDAAMSEGVLVGSFESPCCLAVLDGVSSGGHGCEASSIGSAVLIEHWLRASSAEMENAEAMESFAQRTAVEMSAEIRRYRDDLPVGSSAASTVAGLILAEEDPPFPFNVGDSRSYRWRDGILVQLSTDHTPEQEMSDYGFVDEAGSSAEKSHVITRALGMGGLSANHVSALKSGLCLYGDVFLLCSDGLTDVVEDDQIEKVLAKDVSARAKATTLSTAALRNGTTDNVTVVVAQVRQEQE